MLARWTLLLFTSLVTLTVPALAQVADPVPDIPVGMRTVTVEHIVTLPDSGSVSRPTARPMTLIGDGSGRRFVVDQNGPIYQLHGDDTLSVFLDLATATDLFANQRQRGVSSAAFHPDFSTPGAAGEGKFYTSSTHPADVAPDFALPSGAMPVHHSVVHEWEIDAADADAIDPTSGRVLFRAEEGYGDHNIGQIGFDPNAQPADPDYGLLFVAMGDGGNVCCPRPSVDPLFVGQDLSSPLGKLLRIDPLESGGNPYSVPASNLFASDGDASTLGEIWAYGLRNPHRFSFDAGGTGRLLISDIGQANVEEINLGANGANFGWSVREGPYLVEHFNEDDVFPLPVGDELLGFTYPVLQYDHDEGDVAVSGGSVYRGTSVPSLKDHYVFGDLVSGILFVAHIDDLDGSGAAPMETLRLIDAASGSEQTLRWMVGGGAPASRADLRFGQDDSGEIYLVTKPDGSVRKLVAAPQCADGIDNDEDGRIDFDPVTLADPLFVAGTGDPACAAAEWPTETSRCQDGINNDVGQDPNPGRLDFDGGASLDLDDDGFVDPVFNPAEPARTEPDPQCTDRPWKDREKTGCGFGFELALLVPALGFARRRRPGHR